MSEQKVSEILEVTLAKGYENIDSFDYCENITEKTPITRINKRGPMSTH